MFRIGTLCLFFRVGAFVARLGLLVLLLFALLGSVSINKSEYRIAVPSCTALVAIWEFLFPPEEVSEPDYLCSLAMGLLVFCATVPRLRSLVVCPERLHLNVEMGEEERDLPFWARRCRFLGVRPS